MTVNLHSFPTRRSSDLVLKENAKPGEKREALCGQGDIYFEMGTVDSENYKRAIDSYDQLISDPQAPPHWRNQALFKKGVCLERSEEHTSELQSRVDLVC